MKHIIEAMQRQAISDPCFHAEECADPKYRKLFVAPTRTFSCILTMNIGLE